MFSDQESKVSTGQELGRPVMSTTTQCSSEPVHRFRARRSGGDRLFTLLLLCAMTMKAQASWGGSSNSDFDETIYGNTFTRGWLSDAKSLAFKVEGCAWGYVEDSEEVGCLEDESEDGTTNWYMMANCRRPQVVYSVYASTSSSTGCNQNNFVGSYVTTGGVSEFVYYLQNYQGGMSLDDDSYGGDDGLPNCEQTDAGYLGLDCDDDGGFAINYFNDEYCVSRTGTSYNQLKQLNKLMSNFMSCTSTYNNDDDGGGSISSQLLYYSSPCTSLDYDLCTDSEAFDERSASSGKSRAYHKKWSSRAYIGGHKSWVTKLKYVVGGLFLLASFIMFTGILFTNRRRRRAMMMRKYRQAKKQKRERNRDSASRKSRSSKKRSKSRNKDKSDGVFT